MKKQQSLPKNFLFISRWGEILDIAYATQNEGNAVKLYIEDKPSREIGTGFVKKVKDWKKHIDWADILIFDYTGFGKECTELRASGKIVFGGSEYTDLLELDRNFGQKELQKQVITETFEHPVKKANKVQFTVKWDRKDTL